MIVLDASAALLGLMNDGESRALLESESIVSRHLVDSEVAHALCARVVRGELDPAMAQRLLQTWRRLGLERVGVTGLLGRVWGLRANVSAYDGTSVARCRSAELRTRESGRSPGGGPGASMCHHGRPTMISGGRGVPARNQVGRRRVEIAMARALFNGTVIAESDDIEIVEGNAYFPLSALNGERVTETDHHTVCPWKGTASYYTITVGDQTAPNAAWYYPDAKPGAEAVAGRVAFYPQITVER